MAILGPVGHVPYGDWSRVTRVMLPYGDGSRVTWVILPYGDVSRVTWVMLPYGDGSWLRLYNFPFPRRNPSKLSHNFHVTVPPLLSVL